MSEETFCGNCKRLVPGGAFTLHSAHCERFIQICKKCEEPVPKAQLEKHDVEVHGLAQCKDCNQQFEKGSMDDHIANDCTKRLISCEFCEVQCIASNLEDHEVACGSRTEMCGMCGNHVLVRMFKLHEQLHLHSTESNAAKVEIPALNQSQVESIEATESSKLKVENNVQDTQSFPKFRNVVCQNFLQAAADVSGTHSAETNNYFQKDDSNLGMNSEDALLPCEFCGKPCTIESLAEHQLLLCESNFETCSRCQEKVAFGLLRSHTCRPKVSSADTILSATYTRKHKTEVDEEDKYWSQYAKATSNVKDSSAEEEVGIPCENCGIPFPMSCIELHEIACKFAGISTQSQAQSLSVGSEVGTKVLGSNLSSFGLNSTMFQEDIFHEIFQEEQCDEPVYLPCSFCNVAVLSSIFEMHEAGCDRFSEHQNRSTASKARKSVPLKPVVKNTRPENASQRALRENIISATETRLPSTPKIQQSQYTVCQLPDGREILKKKTPISNNNDFDVGQVLGRSQANVNMDYGPAVLSRPSYGVNHLESYDDLDLGQSNRMKGGIEKNMFHQSDVRKPSTPINRSRNDVSGFGRSSQKSNAPGSNIISQKSSAEQDNFETRIAKKPNASFSNYAYQPDAGNRLGRGHNSMNERPHNGAIPKTGRFENREKFQQNQQEDEMRGFQQAKRDQNDGAKYGARPKQPSQTRGNF